MYVWHQLHGIHKHRPVASVHRVLGHPAPGPVRRAPSDVGQLADLPPYEVLLGSIAGSLTAGVGGIVGVLNALMRDIADMIDQVAHKNESA